MLVFKNLSKIYEAYSNACLCMIHFWGSGEHSFLSIFIESNIGIWKIKLVKTCSIKNKSELVKMLFFKKQIQKSIRSIVKFIFWDIVYHHQLNIPSYLLLSKAISEYGNFHQIYFVLVQSDLVQISNSKI